MTDKNTEQRLIDLETKAAYQEVAIDDLQRMVYDQHKTLLALAARVQQLGKTVEGSAAPDIGPADEKPPHY